MKNVTRKHVVFIIISIIVALIIKYILDVCGVHIRFTFGTFMSFVGIAYAIPIILLIIAFIYGRFKK